MTDQYNEILCSLLNKHAPLQSREIILRSHAPWYSDELRELKREKRRLERKYVNTVEPRFNEPLFKEVFDITNDILGPGQSYSKMYGIEPRYNEFFDITNIIRKARTYLDITNYNVNTRQKINAELINSQQIL